MGKDVPRLGTTEALIFWCSWCQWCCWSAAAPSARQPKNIPYFFPPLVILSRKEPSPVKCTREKGKTIRRGHINEREKERAVPWVDLSTECPDSSVRASNSCSQNPLEKVCHSLLVARSSRLLVPAKLLISACDWVRSGDRWRFWTEWDFCSYSTCFVSWKKKIGTYLLIQGAAGRESIEWLRKVNVSC